MDVSDSLGGLALGWVLAAPFWRLDLVLRTDVLVATSNGPDCSFC